MGFGKLLEQKMNDKNIKQSELAQAVGIPKTTLSSMILRDNTKIEIEKFLKICDYLDCDPEDFYKEFRKVKTHSMPPSFTEKYYSLDSYGKNAVQSILNIEYDRCSYNEEKTSINLPFSLLKASAGTGDWLDEEQLDTISVFDTPAARKADIVIEVDGNSMLPDFSDGDKVFVRLQPSVCENDIGIFFVDGCGYIKKMGNNELISTNPEFDNIPIYDYTNFRCIGKVIGKV